MSGERDARRTASADETAALGEAFARALEAGDLVLLTGPLGAGKTRFVAGLARGLGARGRVRSPSFTLVNEYANGRVPLYHLDLYRLEGGDTWGLGLDEMRERGVLAVEWGDRLPEAARTDALTLEFAHAGGDDRTIAAHADSGRGLALLGQWRALAGAAA